MIEGKLTENELALQFRLDEIGRKDTDTLVEKGRNYGDSWKRRGGIGAFMMLARKWDRIEEQVKKDGYDIFASIAKDMRAEGMLDDIRDLRRYLLLVEDEMTRDPHTEMAPVTSRSVAVRSKPGEIVMLTPEGSAC